MAGRITRPNDEIDLVLQILVYPFEGGIDQGDGRVTVGGLGAENACWSFSSMTGIFLL